MTPPREQQPAAEYPIRQSVVNDTVMTTDINALPPIQSNGLYSDGNLGVKQEYAHSRRESRHQSHSHTGSDTSFLTAPPSSSYSNPEQVLTPTVDAETRQLITSPEELLFMQVVSGFFFLGFLVPIEFELWNLILFFSLWRRSAYGWIVWIPTNIFQDFYPFTHLRSQCCSMHFLHVEPAI